MVELMPPGLRTELMPGQTENLALPTVDELLDEVFALLGSQPDGGRITVEAAKFYGDAEREGRYADTFAFNVSLTA